MGFTADRRVHLSAFGDSAIWAVAVIGSGHVPHASPDFLRRRRLEHPLAADAQPIPRRRHRCVHGLLCDTSSQTGGAIAPACDWPPAQAGFFRPNPKSRWREKEGRPGTRPGPEEQYTELNGSGCMSLREVQYVRARSRTHDICCHADLWCRWCVHRTECCPHQFSNKRKPNPRARKDPA